MRNNINERKEWECNNKENKLRTNLLLLINKEIQKTLSSQQHILINSKKPRDIITEYEQYEIVINAPLIIGNKRNGRVVYDQYQRNSNQQQQSTVEYSFKVKTKQCLKKKIGEKKQQLTKKSTASFPESPQEDSFFKSNNNQSEVRMNKGMVVLKQIAFGLISKPLPKQKLLRQATKHETMGVNKSKIMRRIEQITFREETSFYNDTHEIHAIDCGISDILNLATTDTSIDSKENYRRQSKRSKTEQLFNNENCELIIHSRRY